MLLFFKLAGYFLATKKSETSIVLRDCYKMEKCY